MIELLKKTVLDFLYPRQLENIELTPEELIQKAKRSEELEDKDILAIFDYKDRDVKKLVWQLKYKNSEQAAEILSKILHQEILGNMEDWLAFENFKEPILVPVPLSKKKLAKRGYNQTEVLVRKVMEIDYGKNFSAKYEILKKVKDTPDQTSIKTKKERQKNLKNCFSIKDRKEILGRNVIIIDDVVTTGATIKEVKRILKANGAKKIKAVVIAH